MKANVQRGSGNLKRWGWLKEVGYVTVGEGGGELEVGHYLFILFQASFFYSPSLKDR